MNSGRAETGLHDETVYGFRCATCGFTLDESNGGYLYLKNDNGVRVPLKDKKELETIARILLNEEFSPRSDDSILSQEMIDIMEDRVGYMSACVCINCLNQFGLDLRKDAIECPHCQSGQVKTFLATLSKPCPKCESGCMDKIT